MLLLRLAGCIPGRPPIALFHGYIEPIRGSSEVAHKPLQPGGLSADSIHSWGTAVQRALDPESRTRILVLALPPAS